MSIEKLGQYVGAIEDAHCGGNVEHRVSDVLVIAVCAVIACAESWKDVVKPVTPRRAGQHLRLERISGQFGA